MDSFVDEGSIVDIYDFKYRNEATLDYDIEDKLSNIKAKTSVEWACPKLVLPPPQRQSCGHP